MDCGFNPPLFHSDSLCWLFQGEAVDLIDRGMAPKIVQPEEGATYDAMMKKAIAVVGTHKCS